jgi:uncharacterized protein
MSGAASGASVGLDLEAAAVAVCRLPPDAPVPAWVDVGSPPIVSVTRTRSELSIVAAEEAVPPEVHAERGWRVLSVRGPLAFSLTGVLASLAVPLADAGVPIFVVSTFDTDWLLVQRDDLDEGVAALERAGHRVHRARGTRPTDVEP